MTPARSGESMSGEAKHNKTDMMQERMKRSENGLQQKLRGRNVVTKRPQLPVRLPLDQLSYIHRPPF